MTWSSLSEAVSAVFSAAGSSHGASSCRVLGSLNGQNSSSPKSFYSFGRNMRFLTNSFMQLQVTDLVGERRVYPSTSNSFFSLIHRLSQVHFTRWTPAGTFCTFSKRRALSTSMLSSTTTWVTPGRSALSVCPPFCFICRWKIWCLAAPIPAGRIYAVTPANVFPEMKKGNSLQCTKNCCQSPIYSLTFLFW